MGTNLSGIKEFIWTQHQREPMMYWGVRCYNAYLYITFKQL